LPQVSLICPASVRSFALSPSQAHITLDDGRELACALLVAADGRDSMVREFAGVNTLGWAYDQSALVANVAHQAPHQQTAWQRFLPSGPLAFLPLADGRSSIVWSTSPAAAKQLLALDEGVFCQALGEAFEQRLGAIETVGPRGVFPLRLQHAERYVLPRLALIGDAAHAIHPLAGQGVNLGFLDAAELAQVLVAARQRGRDIGALPVLRRYERARKGDNLAMLGAMDLFKRLFSNDSMPLRLLRNTGLGLADRIFPAKRSLLRRALGIGMDLPELANPGNHQKTP
jgi:2-octaprenylphenol hydroxylase